MNLGIIDVNIAARAAELQKIQGDKTLIALPRAEVAMLDRTLADRWGVDFHDGASDVWSLVRKSEDDAAVARMRELHDAVALGKRHDDADFYGAMAHPAIVGPMTSKRRHLILDVTAAAIGIYRRLGLTGDVLDAGCHVGIIASLVAEALGCGVTGIDPAGEAVALGRAHPARHASG